MMYILSVSASTLTKAGTLRWPLRYEFLGRTERDLGFFSSSLTGLFSLSLLAEAVLLLEVLLVASFDLDPLRALLDFLLVRPSPLARRVLLRGDEREADDEAWTIVGVKGFHCPLFFTLGVTNFSFSFSSTLVVSAAASLGAGQSNMCIFRDVE